MATVWRNILILVFAHFVASVSQTPKKCGKPTKYRDKQLMSKFIGQDTVTYKCLKGYSHSGGARTSQCLNGRWTPLIMNCTKIECNALGDIENGQYTREGRSFGDKAFAECNEGYVLRGKRVRVCMEKGWNGTDPICEKPKNFCSAPAVANRWVKPGEKTQYTPRETVTISCSEGFDLIGSSAVTCGPDGQWKGLPECRRKVIHCSAPTVADGRINGLRGQYTPQETVTISCREGFDLIGSSAVTCGPDGQWKGLPECRPKTGKCGRASSHTNMEVMTESGDLVRYRCRTGYRRARGRDSIYCKDGRWTYLALRCEQKKCGSAGEISFGRFEYTGVLFGDSATAICQEGYELIGKQTLTCRDGGWDGRIPVCEPMHCPPPPEVQDAEMDDPIYDHVPYGHVVSYYCRSGALIGASEIYCTKDGTWSAPPPECKDITCPRPDVPDGTRIRGLRSVYKFGNTVTILCAPYSTLIGESLVTCGPHGKWEPNLPKCVRKSYNRARSNFK